MQLVDLSQHLRKASEMTCLQSSMRRGRTCTSHLSVVIRPEVYDVHNEYVAEVDASGSGDSRIRCGAIGRDGTSNCMHWRRKGLVGGNLEVLLLRR